MNPMHPIQRVEIIATSTKRLVSGAQSSVGTIVASRMMSPPIVGVPRSIWWLAGPSARITWPTFRARRRAMIGGPATNASNSAVTVAPAARNEM